MKFKDGALPEKITDRIKYLYRFQELLRLYHNTKSAELRDGKITEKTFRNFQSNWFNPRNNLLCAKINECKQFFKEDNTVQVKIEDIVE